MASGVEARRIENVAIARRTERPMIGAVNATGWAKGPAPALEPTVSRTAMNEAAPTFSPQKITWSAQGQMRRALTALRMTAKRTFDRRPTKYVWLRAVNSPGPGPFDGSLPAEMNCWVNTIVRTSARIRNGIAIAACRMPLAWPHGA